MLQHSDDNSCLKFRAKSRLDIQKKVLLFGQSAGAENVYAIATLPQAPSLINSVISESGGGRGLINNATTQKVGASYAQALNCNFTDVSVPILGYSTERANLYTESLPEVQNSCRADQGV